MLNKKNYDGKHLTSSQRLVIEKGLNDGESFAEIGRKTGKDSGTISKEVRRHLVHHTKKEFDRDIPCVPTGINAPVHVR